MNERFKLTVPLISTVMLGMISVAPAAPGGNTERGTENAGAQQARAEALAHRTQQFDQAAALKAEITPRRAATQPQRNAVLPHHSSIQPSFSHAQSL